MFVSVSVLSSFHVVQKQNTCSQSALSVSSFVIDFAECKVSCSVSSGSTSKKPCSVQRSKCDNKRGRQRDGGREGTVAAME